MKFICITLSAAEAIAADKQFQSIESEDGIVLANYISGGGTEVPVRPRIIFTKKSDGISIKGKVDDLENVLVIDVEQANVFKGFGEQDIITIFQKIIRYSIKYWKNLRTSSYEWNIANSTKTVVFPFPVSAQTSFRIVFERDPDSKRSRRRPGNYLLLYKSGTKEGDGADEIANVTNFRKAISFVHQHDLAVAKSDAAQDEQLNVNYSVTALDELKSKSAFLMPFDNCMHLVTRPQKDFITADYRSIQRLEGPAGTGKSLCLRLRAIQTLRSAILEKREHHLLYVVPSDELCKQTRDAFLLNDDKNLLQNTRNNSLQSIHIVTLQELCANLLNTEISPTEFLDIDSMESKNTQLLYLSEILSNFIERDLETFKKSLSVGFCAYFTSEKLWQLAELFQHEISYIIKGRARQSLERYKHIARDWNGLPLNNDADINTSFMIFQRYQDRLEESSQFDIDDIVISAIQQLEAPIWKRRRKLYGYDSIIIDEIHLFNMNELSVFHNLTRVDTEFNFSYSIDKTQAIGDTGWSQESFNEALALSDKSETNNPVSTIFRSSPQIVELAFSITSTGSSLFTSFVNPLEQYIASFTFEDEQKSLSPVYWPCVDDNAMIRKAFERAEELNRSLQCGKANVLIVSFDEALWNKIKNYSMQHNKPVALLTRRGDFGLIKSAQQTSRFVLSLPEYVGGLEFSVVLLVGIDKGRVPQSSAGELIESSAYLKYAALNKLYVAITRAKYIVELFGDKTRGSSELLRSAFERDVLTLGE